MEPAKIDWKNLQWRFVEDELYEHINAPKWIDFNAIHDPVDDEAWFCRPDCKHPKTAEELLRVTPSKLTSLGQSPEIRQLSDRIRRDLKLKRRGPAQSSNSSNSENQNPNFFSPQIAAAKSAKAEIKSSAEKKPLVDDPQPKNHETTPVLKSTLSARNLFAGRDILNQITEFCNEIKRMATRAKEKENTKQLILRNGAEAEKKGVEKEASSMDLNNLERKENERKPFSELGKEKPHGTNSNSANRKQKSNIKFRGDSENVPISLDLEKVWSKRDDSMLQIRTNPPTPQCFSNNKITPSKAPRSRLKEKEILGEVGKKKQVGNEEPAERVRSIAAAGEKEARTLDVLWFLKPCTLSS